MTTDNWGNSPVPFIPGQELSRRFYHAAVRPLLDRFFPRLPHSAALVGYGSDVLGFDTPMSRDHMWGPRLVLFLQPAGVAEMRAAVDETLRNHLPLTFEGYPTHFTQPAQDRVRWMATKDEGPVDHLVVIHSIPEFIRQELGVDLSAPLEARDWLVLPQQKLLAVTAGEVYHDDLDLASIRARFAFYPPGVWLYLLACQWTRIAQEEAFVGRTGSQGDDLGSRLIAARLVHDLMGLAFLLEKRYAPYAKWFGAAFRRLEIAPVLEPILASALAATEWQAREAALSQAYEIMADRQNAAGLTEPLDAQTRSFFERPFRVLFAGRFADALRAHITDPWLKHLPLYGSIDQFSTSTDLREDVDAWARLRSLYPAS